MNHLHLLDCKKFLLPRLREAHKGLFGHVLVIGGDYGMGGAVRLAAEAALRTGAGLVSVVTRSEHAYAIMGARPELMCYGVFETSLEAVLRPLFERVNIVLLGPGLGQKEWGLSLFQYVLKHWSFDLILDGDALNLLAQYPTTRENWILSPHPGEASRLLQAFIPVHSVDFIQNNRLSALQDLYKAYHGTIVLKGANTMVIGKNGIPAMCLEANPAMATAGMGDVLAGMISALVGQKLSLEAAAQLAVCAHAKAGALAADGQERGILASDLFPKIVECLN